MLANLSVQVLTFLDVRFCKSFGIRPERETCSFNESGKRRIIPVRQFVQRSGQQVLAEVIRQLLLIFGGAKARIEVFR